jgi:hypothetical protein
MEQQRDLSKREKHNKRNSKWYHEGNGKIKHKICYLIKKNNIDKSKVNEIEDLEEQLKYCQEIHIKNKYNIKFT